MCLMLKFMKHLIAMNLRIKKIIILLPCLGLLHCAAPQKPEIRPIAEWVVLDNEKTKNLRSEFDQQSKLLTDFSATSQNYLKRLAQSIAKQEIGFDDRSIDVQIHDDHSVDFKRIFAFPGTVISIPKSFLLEVEYENELASAIAFGIAQVIDRTLAQRLQQLEQELLSSQQPDSTRISFLNEGLYQFGREERQRTIQIAARLLYQANIDVRGLSSFFQRYYGALQGPIKPDTELNKKEVSLWVMESNRIRSERTPLRDPLVRSADFILMKNSVRQEHSRANKTPPPVLKKGGALGSP
jgi:hypothetical protein